MDKLGNSRADNIKYDKLTLEEGIFKECASSKISYSN